MKGMGNDLIREARKRSRLTQAQLAALAGTTQSAIARLESGRTAPSFDDVIRMLRLMGLDLDFMLVPRDDSDWIQAQRLIGLTPEERMVRLAHWLSAVEQLRDDAGSVPNATTNFDPVAMLTVLDRHDVDFVVTGSFATALHGSPFLTDNLDITPDRTHENLERLSAALLEIGAQSRVHDEKLPSSLDDTESLDLTTKHGKLDISSDGYPDLVRDAETMTLAGVQVHVASLADIIRSKQAANRPKDQRVLPTLREILASRHERNR